MVYSIDNVRYYGLDFTPNTPEEGINALKKIQDCVDGYKPDVAIAALRYYSVVLRGIEYCNFREYLAGEVYSKMSVLTSRQRQNPDGYVNAFSTAIDLMIRNTEFYFKYKEKLDKNISRSEILGI